MGAEQRHVGNAIRRIRQSQGISQAVLAGLAGHSQSWLSKLEAGERDLLVSELTALARALRVEPSQITDWTATATPVSAVITGVPWTGAGALTVLRQIGVITMEDVQPTGDLTRMTDWLTAPPAELISPVGRRLELRDAQRMDSMAATLRRMDDKLGGSVTLQVARGQLDGITSLLENRSYDNATSRQLHTTAAELLRLCGWTAHDAGMDGRALRYWHTALYAAHAAGDRGVASNVSAFISDIYYAARRTRQALDFARTAAEGYPGGSVRVGAWMDAVLGRAYGLAGERRDALRLAERILIAADSELDEGPDWAYWVDRDTLRHLAGSIYRTLGMWPEAAELLTATLAAPAADSWIASCPREIAGIRLRLAAVLASGDRPELDRAVEEGSAALDILDRIDSAQADVRWAELRTALAPYRTRSAVADLLDRTAA